ncbi:MAG: CRISPR-associated protein [Comamonadaceae bacterium]|nr:MAG: CRISPR-associated protein [Comamonadaceae bacterium]
MSSEPLYLLHTQPDPQRLAAWAARHRLLDKEGDLGYALHALLHAAFGEQAPQPFRYLDAEQGLLAYTRLDAPGLAHGRCAGAWPDTPAWRYERAPLPHAVGRGPHAGV